jgi:hypothetical protein
MTSNRLNDLEAENGALREELAGFRRARMAWPLVPAEFDQPTRAELGQIFEAALRRGRQLAPEVFSTVKPEFEHWFNNAFAALATFRRHPDGAVDRTRYATYWHDAVDDRLKLMDFWQRETTPAAFITISAIRPCTSSRRTAPASNAIRMSKPMAWFSATPASPRPIAGGLSWLAASLSRSSRRRCERFRNRRRGFAISRGSLRETGRHGANAQFWLTARCLIGGDKFRRALCLLLAGDPAGALSGETFPPAGSSFEISSDGLERIGLHPALRTTEELLSGRGPCSTR